MILLIILFNGQIITQEYPTLESCQIGMYRAMDEIFIKNIESIECKKG